MRPGTQVGKIPPPTVPGSVAAKLRRLLRSQTGGILIRIAAFIFENYESLLTMLQKKIQKGCRRVIGIGQKQIKGPRIGRQYALEQAQGRGQFRLPGLLRLQIQQQAYRRTIWRSGAQQHQGHIAMAYNIFNAFFARNLKPELRHGRTMEFWVRLIAADIHAIPRFALPHAPP